MKKIFFCLTMAALVFSFISCSKPGQDGAAQAPNKEVKLESFPARLSYVLGTDIGSSLREMGKEVDLDTLYKGIQDSFKGGEILLTAEEIEAVKMEFSSKMQEEFTKKNNELTVKNKQEGESFLAENKNKEGVVTTESGLQYIVLTEGDGPVPTENDKVKVHYRGTLINGTEFDSSYKRNAPAVFQVKGVIPGWTEALLLMKTGSKYQLFVPAALAYGERAVGPDIGPNSTLLFEVELLSIEK
ncbi:MAG: FKBP-type peptidyl-prolyl cis-trans isomerase [Proteobacteria bacterium]|nr:FKBP-type peptidyl-prolyl cis-trans isomerase [Pseudomonadota bacterium]MBU1717355.1 FKBP-type peptidyl-prolyl cis-trans isomerase [Pseudomonadota bacterium]